jgi:xylose isomerase
MSALAVWTNLLVFVLLPQLPFAFELELLGSLQLGRNELQLGYDCGDFIERARHFP